MDDELEFDLDTDTEDITRKDKRLKSLSDKVKEKDEALSTESEARKKAEEERDSIRKENEFFKGFNTVSSKYQGASEFQEQIFEKVKAGYDVEDATISVLAREGKFTAPKQEIDSAAGGSASTTLSGGEKTMDEMSRDEKRAQLADLESRGEFKL